jgi:hypothetical protein
MAWVNARDGLDELRQSDPRPCATAPRMALEGELLPDWYDD